MVLRKNVFLHTGDKHGDAGNGNLLMDQTIKFKTLLFRAVLRQACGNDLRYETNQKSSMSLYPVPLHFHTTA